MYSSQLQQLPILQKLFSLKTCKALPLNVKKIVIHNHSNRLERFQINHSITRDNVSDRMIISIQSIPNFVSILKAINLINLINSINLKLPHQLPYLMK